MKTFFALLCEMVESGPRSHSSDKHDNTEHEVNEMINKNWKKNNETSDFLSSLVISQAEFKWNKILKAYKAETSWYNKLSKNPTWDWFHV